jgi:hypothetical protein
MSQAFPTGQRIALRIVQGYLVARLVLRRCFHRSKVVSGKIKWASEYGYVRAYDT